MCIQCIKQYSRIGILSWILTLETFDFELKLFFWRGRDGGHIFFLNSFIGLKKAIVYKMALLFFFFGIAISVVVYVFLLIKVENHAWNMMLVAILLLWSVTCCHGDTMQHLVLLDNLPPSFQQNSTPNLVITTNYSVSTRLFI